MCAQGPARPLRSLQSTIQAKFSQQPLLYSVALNLAKTTLKNGQNCYNIQGRGKPYLYRPKCSALLPASFLPNLVEIGDSVPEIMGVKDAKTLHANTGENFFTDT